MQDKYIYQQKLGQTTPWNSELKLDMPFREIHMLVGNPRVTAFSWTDCKMNLNFYDQQ